MKTMNLQTIGRELKNTANLVAIAVFVLGMTACTQDNEPVAHTDPHAAVSILAGVTGIQSRAYADDVDDVNGKFKENAAIKVINKNATDEAAKYTFVTDAWTATTPLYWDTLTVNGNSKYEFIGVYPDTAAWPVKYTIGGEEVMMAFSSEVEAKKQVALDFKHILSKLTVVITLENGFPISFEKILTPKITLLNVFKTATFKDTSVDGFAGFDLTAQGSVQVDANKADNNITYTFMLPAQKITELTLSAEGLSLPYSYKAADEGFALEQGKNTTLTLTLKKTELIPNGEIKVSPWGESTGVNGDLI